MDGEDDVRRPAILYENEYSCWPPKLGMVIISVIEMIFFHINEFNDTFIYDPTKRYQLLTPGCEYGDPSRTRHPPGDDSRLVASPCDLLYRHSSRFLRHFHHKPYLHTSRSQWRLLLSYHSPHCRNNHELERDELSCNTILSF